MTNSAKLLYNSLSLVYMQIFTVEDFCHAKLNEKEFIPDPNSIDRQIFNSHCHAQSPVRRYKLKGFSFSLVLNEEPEKVATKTRAQVKGTIYVEMSVFFNRTVSLSYRMMIDGQTCLANKTLDSDEIISLSALCIGAEHWNLIESCETEGTEGTERTEGAKRTEGAEGTEGTKTASNINLDIAEITVDNFHLDESGKVLPQTNRTGSTELFKDIQQRYKRFVLNSQIPQPKELDQVSDLNYVFIDIWEDIAHSEGIFAPMESPEIISHIFNHHKQELVGLMSFYPYEWPYRSVDSFEDICGSNVAIDTDDLILLNQNICMVFGTYGLRGRGEPTDWEKHLGETRQTYHVSWPEYLLILEMILAKKYTLSVVSDVYLERSIRLTSLDNTRMLIEKNSRDGVAVTKLLMSLDAIKYSRYISHKIMFERTTKRLEVEREFTQLNETIARIDKYLFSISEMRKLRQSVMLNVILGIISAASLFGILFQSIEIPILKAIGLQEYSGGAGKIIITITLALILISAVTLVASYFRNNKFK